MTRFELNILGCGSATCTLRHMPSCQVLNVRDTLLMIDCGEAAQLNLRRMRLKFHRLRHIFISHLHGDHVFGLPGLVSTIDMLEFTGTLTVHTFAEGIGVLKRMIDFFDRERGYNLEFNAISPEGGEVIVDAPGYTVETFPLYHRVPCVGFKVSEKPKLRHIDRAACDYHGVPQYLMNDIRAGADFVKPDGTVVPASHLTHPADPSHTYAYCSDTMYDERVAASVSGVDWLYHEATYGDDSEAKAEPRGHSTARQAGRIARMAGAKHLIIGHYSKRYTDEEPLAAQAREEFPDVIAAREGMTIDLNK